MTFDDARYPANDVEQSSSAVAIPNRPHEKMLQVRTGNDHYRKGKIAPVNNQHYPTAKGIISKLLAGIAERTAPHGSAIRVTSGLLANKTKVPHTTPRPLETPMYPLYRGPPRSATRARRVYLEHTCGISGSRF